MKDPIIGTWQGFAHKNNEYDSTLLHAKPKTYGTYTFNSNGTGSWTSKVLFKMSTTPFQWESWGDGDYSIDYLSGMHWHDAVYVAEDDVLMLRNCVGPTAGMIRYLHRV